MTISEELITHIISSGLVAGYTPILGGIRDDLPTFVDANKWISCRRAGGGGIDPLYSEPVYQLMIGGKQSYSQEFESNSDSIIDFVNANYEIGTIRNIIVQSQPVGPLFLSDNRVYFMITLQLLQNRG